MRADTVTTFRYYGIGTMSLNEPSAEDLVPLILSIREASDDEGRRRPPKISSLYFSCLLTSGTLTGNITLNTVPGPPHRPAGSFLHAAPRVVSRSAAQNRLPFGFVVKNGQISSPLAGTDHPSRYRDQTSMTLSSGLYDGLTVITPPSAWHQRVSEMFRKNLPDLEGSARFSEADDHSPVRRRSPASTIPF